MKEEVGLHITFEECKLRGATDTTCLVRAVEEGMGVEVSETLSFDSWEDMKEEYPTLVEMMEDFQCTVSWNADWRGGNRILFIETIAGHEGLYEYDGNVSVEC